MIGNGSGAAVIDGRVHIIAAAPADCGGIELPTEVVLFDTGQIIAVYPLLPPVPYDNVEAFLIDHAQGQLTPAQLRARLKSTVAGMRMTVADVEAIMEKAVAFYGSFAISFTPRASS